MADQSVIIEVSPSKLEVALVRDRAVADSRVHHHDTQGWDKAWPGVLNTLEAKLAQMITDLGCAGAKATVFYTAPGSVATISSCPSATNADDARQAAEMAITGLAGFSIDRNLFQVSTITRDTLSKGAANESTKIFVPNTHSLAIAESDDRAAAIAAWVGAAGLKLAGMAPLESVILRSAARLCVEPHSPGEVLAVLWLGDHSSVLAVGQLGRLSFVRAIAAGTDSFIDAIARPLRTRNAEAASVSLDRPTLRSILAQVGIPAPGTEIPGGSDLTGASLLPLLQPVIQRLALETKQSVRFGVGEEERPNVRLYLAGPGAALANLAQSLSTQSGFPLGGRTTTAQTESAHTAEPRGARRVIDSYLSDKATIPLLLPHAHQQTQTATRVRRALWGGVAVAGGLIAFDSIITRAELQAQTQTLDALRSLTAADATLVRSHDRSLHTRTEIIATQGRIRAALGQTPDWAAIIRALGRATPPEIRITSINLQSNSDGARCQLRASLRTDAGQNAGQNAAALIKDYIDRLGANPLIESVKLGTCQRGVVDGHEAQNFDLTLLAVSLPALAHPGDGWGDLAATPDSPEGTP